MAKTLAERLRDCAQGVSLGADGMGWGPDPAMLEEAADKIVSLHAELQHARDGLTNLEAARRELAKVNNEFGSENADWPEAWRRVAEVKERAGRLWRDNETLRAALTVVVRDWTEQFERNGHLAPAWVRQAREALGPNVEVTG